MNALVIGGNRFFGKKLVHLLLDRGVQVTLLNRNQTPDNFGSRVKRIVLDRRELRKNHPSLGSTSWDIIYDQVCYDANEALSACETFQDRAKKYVFTSSQSVYSYGKKISESEFNPSTYVFDKPIDRDQDYAEAKKQAEAIFAQKSKFPVTIVRFPMVLGEDDYTERLLFHVKKIAKGVPLYFPNMEAKLSFIHSTDAASFLNFLFDQSIQGPINCCSTEPIALKSITKNIEVITDQTAKISNDPQNEHSLFGIQSDWFMNTAKLNELGFSARPVTSWLPALIEDLSTRSKG